MTAPRFTCRNTKNALAERGPSIHDDNMTSRTATLIGLTAILMWSLLAALTVATGKIPAFQLAAMTFAIGALAGFLSWIGRPDAIRALVQSPIAWIVGVGGLFGYHALYFLALRFAPPAEPTAGLRAGRAAWRRGRTGMWPGQECSHHGRMYPGHPRLSC